MHEVLGFRPWRAQRELIELFLEYPQLLAHTGKNVGKTTLIACLVLYHVLTERNNLSIVTANTEDQVKNQIFAEIRARHAGARVRLPGTMLKMALYLGPKWFALGMSPDKPESMQGYHAIALVNPKYANRPDLWDKISDDEYFDAGTEAVATAGGKVLGVIDEAAGADRKRHEAMKGIVSNPGSKLVQLGNPGELWGPFYEDAHPPEHLRESWHVAIKNISTLDAPKGLVDQRWIETTTRECSRSGPPEKNSRYRRDILGLWPLTGDEQVYSLTLLESCADLQPLVGGRHMGVDIARGGEDRCVAVLLESGVVTAIKVWGGFDDTLPTYFRSASIIRRLMEGWEVAPENVHIDVTGGHGYGPYEILWEWRLPVDGVDFSEAPEHDWRDVLGHGPKLRNRRQELHWVALRLFEERLLSVPKVAELSPIWQDLTQIQRKKKTRSGYWEVEEKPEFKARVGRSPDGSDALITALSRVEPLHKQIRRVHAREQKARRGHRRRPGPV